MLLKINDSQKIVEINLKDKAFDKLEIIAKSQNMNLDDFVLMIIGYTIDKNKKLIK